MRKSILEVFLIEVLTPAVNSIGDRSGLWEKEEEKEVEVEEEKEEQEEKKKS